MWRTLRIIFLLLVLVVVAGQTWLDHLTTTSWNQTLWVGIYPLNGDGSEVAERYVHSLAPETFADIERFFATEGHRYGIAIEQPVHVELYPSPARPPPAVRPDSSVLARLIGSLELRWYAAFGAGSAGRPPPKIRVYVLYHDPASTPQVPHSLGLRKGLIGVVYAFADSAAAGSNSVVIAHELMHTLGATDKYDPATEGPLYPDGYAEPDRKPLYPQPAAEIMAGRRAISASEVDMPDSLREVVVGPLTATEIRWSH